MPTAKLSTRRILPLNLIIGICQKPLLCLVMKILFSKSSIILLIIIAVVAVSLSLLSYQYSTSTSNEIIEVASKDIRTNTEIQAHDVSRILVNKIDIISTHLHVIANAPSVKNGEYERSRVFFDTAENVVGPPADFFAVLNQDGKLMWSSNINQTQIEQFLGLDLSSRPYFTQPQDTHQPYYSTTIESVDNIARIFMSVPVIDSDGNFKGITYSGIRLDTAGQLLQNELQEEFQARISILDREGLILHTQDPSFIGKSIFSDEIQSRLFPTVIPAEEKDTFTNLMRTSLQGKASSADITIRGVKNTIAFEPVIVDDQHFLTIFAVAPHVLASDVGLLITQQNSFSIMLIATIGAVAFGTATLVLLWNRRLTETVETRTAELRKANEQLKINDRLQREFINIAAHELRTPIQPILSAAELTSLDNKSNGKMNTEEVRISKDAFDVILRNARRLESLSNDILEVARIESQSLTLKKEVFNLDEVIQNAVTDVNELPLSNGKKVEIQYNSVDILVDADSERISQVIYNLLSNARKFTKEGSIVVSVEERKDQGSVVIRVKDTGRGIDQDVLPRLFTKFATKSEKGTGLGLYISKSIIEAHGGRIWAENNADGKGATFSFLLPLTTVKNEEQKVITLED
jgi:signal transduction histidine kinase